MCSVNHFGKLMDWKAIIAGAISGAGVAGVFVAVMNKVIERTVLLRFERLAEKHRIELQESVRRQAFVYDRQFEVARQALSEIYRTRNILKEVLKCFPERPLKQVTFGNHATLNSLHEQLKKSVQTFYELLYEDHSLMPREFFGVFHALKNRIVEAEATMHALITAAHVSADEVTRSSARLLETLHAVEEHRSTLLEMFQSRFVTEGESGRS